MTAQRPGRRGAVAAVVLLAWVVGLGLLARRELFRGPVERLAEMATRVSPGAVFFEVEQQGRHIGYASSTIDTTGKEIQIKDAFVADLSVGGGVHRASAQSNVHLSRRLALKSFEVSFVSDSAPINVTGVMSGDSVLSFTIRSASAPADTQRLRTNGPILLPTLVPLAVALGSRPKVGVKYTVPVFDPAAMASKNVGVAIDAESLFTVSDSAAFDSAAARWVTVKRDTIRAWRITTPESGVVTGWVDEQGRLVQTAQPGGITLRRTAFELAFENWRIDRIRNKATASDRDVLETTAIGASVPLHPKGFAFMRAKLGGALLSGYDLAGGRQTLSGDQLSVTRENDAALTAGYALKDTIVRSRFGKYLASEPLLQVTDTAIRSLADRITKGTRDPRVAAERINKWVYDSLRKEITVSVPSALQVLHSRRGDCNEHTQLFLALARAAGVPARGAAGLVHLNNKFYYHAWPEIFLGTWVAVDPTFGEFPADAGHLRFVSGGFTRQADLLRLIGSLTIDIVDAR